MPAAPRTARLDPSTLSRIRWSRDPQGVATLVDRLVRRAVALTDAQVEEIRAALAAREEARR